MEKYNYKDTANVSSLLLVGALVATMLPHTVLGAQTTLGKQPNLQAQISNASSAKNTNANATVPAPSLGNTYQRKTIIKSLRK